MNNRGRGAHVRRIWRRAAALIAVTALGIGAVTVAKRQDRVGKLERVALPEWIEPALIPVGNARSGCRLTAVRGIVIHYVGNPNTTAMNNRHYFALESTEVCAHFVVGLEGEIVQCLPLWERSAASNHRNKDTISIEVCHPDESGQFNAVTYGALVRLTAWLCRTAGLDAEDVIRHYDVTGKLCPLYYVRHEEAWEQLRADIAAAVSSL